MKKQPCLMLSFCLSLCALPACKSGEKTSPSATSTESKAESTPSATATPEAAVIKIAKLQNDMAAVMESITDTATAEAALPRIALLANEFSQLGNTMKTMNPDMSPELKTKMEGIMLPAMERMKNAIGKAMPIITQNPDLANRFQEAMDKMR